LLLRETRAARVLPPGLAGERCWSRRFPRSTRCCGRAKFAIAAAFHDLGIWTDATFDYLKPSVGLAVAHLRDTDRESWIPEVSEMILEHHKLSPYRRDPHSLVEPFRRADWVDVSRGLLRFGLSRTTERGLLHVAQRGLSQAPRPAIPRAAAGASVESAAADGEALTEPVPARQVQKPSRGFVGRRKRRRPSRDQGRGKERPDFLWEERRGKALLRQPFCVP